MTTGHETGSGPPVAGRDDKRPASGPVGEAIAVDAAVMERADTYGMLATLLAGPPPAELLARLAELAGGSESGRSPLGDAWRGLGEAARSSEAERVAEEYQDVLIGLTEGEVIPYGSWYRTGSLLDRPLMLLRSDLARLGFAREPGVREPEDHAAMLCEVMGALLEQVLGEERATTAPAAAGFYRAHLQPWLPAFFADLQRAPSARFYVAVGRLGERLMAHESGYWARRADGPETARGERPASGVLSQIDEG